ncbi:MAG TPA: PAS domain-containing protein [Steroidobacteraceae bacterium]|nr:PAS domain-containing protein [Steroidobacteraceae bacterium]HUA23648.1 PAS domain-containing protein [Steroidobacteraceae bacterium]
MDESPGNKAMRVHFDRIVNALPALVWTTQGDGRSDFVNRHWCEYTGLAPDAALDHGWRSAIHPDDLTSFLEGWSVIQQSGIAREIDGRLRRFDGEYRWFVFRPSFMEDVGGRGRWCWLGLNADESPTTDGRLRRLFDMLPWQAGFLNKAGVLEFTNLQSLKDFNMTREQLERWTASGIIHADDHEKDHNAVTALLTTGEMMDLQVRMLYPHGAYRWTRARCVPVRDAQGNVVRYVTFQIDVDDLKRAEDLLAAEVKLLERVARGEALGEVLGALSRRVEELCNGCFCHILLVAADRKHFEAGAGAGPADAFKGFLDGRSIDRGGCDPYSMAFIAKAPIITADLADDSRWQGSAWQAVMKTHGYASCWSMPIVSGSAEASGIIAIHRHEPAIPTAQEQDLMDRFAKIAGIAIDRTRADEALNQARLELTHVARMATLSAMTASITHEVSQPISGILTNANTCARMLAADPPNVAGAAETVRRTIRDAHRATEVIKRLRAMFAKKAPTLEMVDLNDAAREVIAMSAAELRRGRSDLQTDFTEPLPPISGDRVQLQQVILNLLLNAADAMAGIEDRPRTLRVQTQIKGSEGVELLVRDSGVGLDPGGIEKLFEAFHTTKAHGLGIGLAISRSIIEGHKGRLWAMPNDGPGATFGFYMPCAADASSKIG